ncbi:MAG: TlpA disulfide reductase family protein [Bacteroidia bacterium]|nr:TlpA disulfide reductase family protein [Bacteroidia bacterium]
MKKTTSFTSALALLIALAMVAASCTQTKKETGYKINGTVLASVSIDSINLYEPTGEKIESVPVINNKFVFTGKLDEPRYLIIGNEEAYFSTDIILENTNYNITILEDGDTYIEGGSIHPDVLGYRQSEEYIVLRDAYTIGMDEAFEDVDMDNEEQVMEARRAMTEYEDKLFAYTAEQGPRVIEGNYPTITKMFALIFNQNWEKYPPDKIRELLNEYEKEVGPHPDLVLFRNNVEQSEQMMANQQNVSNGAPYREITGQSRDGNTVQLSDVVAENKYTLLEFWASWCGPCRAEIPNLKKVYEKYKSQGLEIISVSLDSDQAHWTNALDDEKTTWINILVNNDFKNPDVAQYGVMGVPASFLINNEGIIVANNQELREFELERTLDRIMNAKE